MWSLDIPKFGSSWIPTKEHYEEMSAETVKNNYLGKFDTQEYLNKTLTVEQQKMLRKNMFKIFKKLDKNGNPIEETIIEQKKITRELNPDDHNMVLDYMITITKYAIKHKLFIETSIG